MDKKTLQREEAKADSRGAATNRPRLDSEKLFAGAREVLIEHAGQEYRLRLTSQNRLILTK